MRFSFTSSSPSFIGINHSAGCYTRQGLNLSDHSGFPCSTTVPGTPRHCQGGLAARLVSSRRNRDPEPQSLVPGLAPAPGRDPGAATRSRFRAETGAERKGVFEQALVDPERELPPTLGDASLGGEIEIE